MTTNRSFSFRSLHLLILVLCLSALAIAWFFMQGQLGLAPCPLCILDRVVLGFIALCSVLALMHNPMIIGQRLYHSLTMGFSIIGIVLAARHIHLQNLPPGEVPDCLPELDYMLDTFSWLETFVMVFNTAGECAETQWLFLGLTIPEQTLLLFIVLFVLGLYGFVRRQ